MKTSPHPSFNLGPTLRHQLQRQPTPSPPPLKPQHPSKPSLPPPSSKPLASPGCSSYALRGARAKTSPAIPPHQRWAAPPHPPPLPLRQQPAAGADFRAALGRSPVPLIVGPFQMTAPPDGALSLSLWGPSLEEKERNTKKKHVAEFLDSPCPDRHITGAARPRPRAALARCLGFLSVAPDVPQ